MTTPFNFSLSGKLSDVPLQLGEWQGEDVPQTNLEVFILLEPEQYVQRMYRLPDGRYVWLSLIGSRKSKSFHSPQICYDTDGWQTEASSVAVPLDKGEVYALQLAAKKDLGRRRQRRTRGALLLPLAQLRPGSAGWYGRG